MIAQLLVFAAIGQLTVDARDPKNQVEQAEKGAPSIHKGPLLGQIKEVPYGDAANVPDFAKGYRPYSVIVPPMRQGTRFLYTYYPAKGGKKGAHIFVVLDETAPRQTGVTGLPGEDTMDENNYGVNLNQLATIPAGTFLTNSQATPDEGLTGQCPNPAPSPSSPVYPPEPTNSGGGYLPLIGVTSLLVIGALVFAYLRKK